MTKKITYAILACYVDKGMRSKGSKSLIEFDKKKLLEYQLDRINSANKRNKTEYEILLVSNFQFAKIKKNFSDQINVIEMEQDTNPVATVCKKSKYDTILFIDYGCVYTKQIIKNITQKDNALIVTTNQNNNNNLEVGVFCENKNHNVRHLFYGIEKNKFTNMFLLNKTSKHKLLSDKKTHRKNLMYFEILNYLIEKGVDIENYSLEKDSFVYFNNVRQTNGISKFIKKTQ